jgi:hypothetical protein
VKTAADPRVLDGLVRRLEGLTPATPRRWGTLSAHEMLCHLADASASVLARPGGEIAPARRVRKLLALYTSIPWPHDLRTPPHVDQRIGGSAPPNAFPRAHGHFGAMLPRDWQRWGYRHTDRHLPQFGL